MKKIIIPIVVIISILIIGYVAYSNVSILPPELLNLLRTLRDSGQEITKSAERSAGVPLKAKIFDDEFIVKEYVTGLSQPTTMTFVGDDILVLEKNSGHVQLIRDGKLISEPIFDFEVSSTNESGLLGIVSHNSDVYIFVTEAKSDGGEIIGNNIYKFTWNGNSLVDQQLINTLSSESSWHNGGTMTINSDGQVFAVIGDQMGGGRPDLKNDFRVLQNVNNGEIDDTGVIVKVGFEEGVIQPKTSGNPLDHYFAIGIRNSFGIAIDPLTGNIWDSENGPDHSDEINFVPENFNSGWSVVMGPATNEQISQIPPLGNFQYSNPEFSWERTVTPTGLEFINSDKFSKYKGDLIVASCNYGQLFKFSLNEYRTGLKFDSEHLQDLVANNIEIDEQTDIESIDEILFGEGFGCLTDVEFGPNGYLYLVSISDNTIYQVLPRN
ncbi:MAG: PQQ-dependent sugar dehydrogenase [Candidatus Nitrosopumilus sp. bin_6a]